MIARQSVLVVDNEVGTRESLRWILKSHFQVQVADNPMAALKILEEETTDVVFSDILMEPFDGITLLRRVKAMNPDIEVVMMTAFARQESLLSALRHGACDYLIKPFDQTQIQDVMRKALAKRAQCLLEERVIADMKKRVQETYKGSVHSLMQALGAKDVYTFSHSRRVADLFVVFAKRHGFSDQDLELYKTTAMLHDVGKIGIRDAILKKPGPLTPEEYEEIKLHPKMGYHIVKHLGLREDGMDVILYHQERYDGKGYPNGLAGNQIPLPARIFSVVDTYDAMHGERPYHKPIAHPDCMAEIHNNAGTQFDPALVQDFESMMKERERRS